MAKAGYLFLLVLFGILVFSQIVLGHDIMIESYLDEAEANEEYTRLFKLKNLNPDLGRVYNITVYYNVSVNGSFVDDGYFVKDEVNHYSTTSTGLFFVSELGNYTLCGKILNSSIDDSNLSNNFACGAVFVGNLSDDSSDSDEEVCEPYIRIEKLYLGSDDEAKFGDAFTVKLKMNRCSSRKYNVKLWVENRKGKKVTLKSTSINLYTKNIDYEITVPLVLESNCDGEYDEGSHYVIAYGLGLEERYKFRIEGAKKCGVETVYIEKPAENVTCEPKNEEKLVCKVEYPVVYVNEEAVKENVTLEREKVTGTVYESSSYKAKKSVLYILIALLGILSIVLIIRR